MMVGLGIVGFIDDFLKVRKKRSLGLGGWAKVAGQLIVATVFALLAINFPNDRAGSTPASTNISIIRDIPINFMAIGIAGDRRSCCTSSGSRVIVAATSNGVNVTDGLDGLAHRRLDPRDRLVHHHRFLAVQPVVLQLLARLRRRLQVLRRAGSARPRRGGRGDRGRTHRVPLVEHLAGTDLHG